MKKYAVIVGGGKGIRLGSETPKQFLPLKGRPVIFHTIEKFAGIADEIILVLPVTHFEYWQQLCDSFQTEFTVTLIAGGETRAQSVKKGLDILNGSGIVAIHDAVRPLVSRNLINNLYTTAQSSGNAAPFINLKESLRQKRGNSSVAVNRSEFFIVQTPQCFDLQQLKTAYQNIEGLEFSDDTGLMEHFGASIHQVEGETSNIKITFKEDLIVAEALINAMNL